MKFTLVSLFLLCTIYTHSIAQIMYLEKTQKSAVAVSCGYARGPGYIRTKGIGIETGKQSVAIGLSYSTTESRNSADVNFVAPSLAFSTRIPNMPLGLAIALSYLGTNNSQVRIPTKHVVVSPSLFLKLGLDSQIPSKFSIIPEIGAAKMITYNGANETSAVFSGRLSALYEPGIIAIIIAGDISSEGQRKAAAINLGILIK